MTDLPSTYLELTSLMKKKYPDIPEYRIQAEIARIQVISFNVRGLAKKRVLDVGGGSTSNTDRAWLPQRLYQRFFNREAYTLFDPWYSRILNEAGAEPVVVDAGDNDSEPFESHGVDLFDPDSLSMFQDESFDAVNNYRCTVPRHSKHAKNGTSPGMYQRMGWDYRRENSQDAFDRQIPISGWLAHRTQSTLERLWLLNDDVMQQVERVLKKGGTYTLAEFIYRKRKNGLCQEGILKGPGS